MSYLAFEFEGSKFDGTMLPDLLKLVEQKIIKVHDLVVVFKDAKAQITSRELLEFDPDEVVLVNPLKSELKGMFTTGDIEAIGEQMRPNTTAALMLVEHLWATKFFQDVMNNKGRLVGNEFVPPALIKEALEDTEAASPKA
jgi:uncharacterized membrane protein